MMRTRNLDTSLLRTYAAIADLGGFARAGASVHLSQPTVSLQMKRLEEQLGSKLFKRSGRALVLSEDGQRLLQYARRILALNDEAWSSFETRELAGVVRFGMIQDLTEELLAEMMAFAHDHPGVKFEVMVSNSADLASALVKGTLDVALLAGAPSETTPLFRREKLFWIAQDDPVLPQDGPVPLVLCATPCGVRDRAIEALEKARIPWRLAFTSPSIMGLKAAVRAGLGITLRGASLLDHGLAKLPGRFNFPPTRPLDIVLATNPQPSPAPSAFARFLRTMCAADDTPRSSGRRKT